MWHDGIQLFFFLPAIIWLIVRSREQKQSFDLIVVLPHARGTNSTKYKALFSLASIVALLSFVLSRHALTKNHFAHYCRIVVRESTCNEIAKWFHFHC